MKSRLSKREENRAAAASLLVELEDEEIGSKLEKHEPVASLSIKEPGSNKVQTEFKLGSNLVQTGFEVGSELNQKTNKVGSKVGSEPSSNLVQTGFKLGSEFLFHRLSPLQQKTLIFFAQQCQLERSKITPPIKCVQLAKNLEVSVDGLKTATKRLLKNGILTIHEYMDGRAGWTRYEIPEHVFKALVLNKSGFELGLNQVQTGFKLGSKVGSEVGSNRSSSSSSYININNTTTTEPNFSIPENLQKRGMGASQLRQILEEKKLSPEQIQSSLNEFSFDLEEGKVRSRNGELNLFFGILRQGKEYVSQKAREAFNKTLENELKALEEFDQKKKELAQIQLQRKFEAFLEKKPDFLEQIKAKYHVIQDKNILMKMALEDFQSADFSQNEP